MNNAPLDNLILGYPCPVDWDSMTGDERKRFCSQCSLNVYNISDMSAEEANSFLLENENACVRFYLRKDGTIKTDSCARYLKHVKQKFYLLKAAVSLFVLFLISACTGSKSESFREDWGAIKEKVGVRYYNPDEYFMMAGRPTRSDLRKAMEVLCPEYREIFYYKSAEEEAVLEDFRHSLVNTRKIQDSELKKVKDYYVRTGNKLGCFNVEAIETLLKLEEPITRAEKIRLGKEFEASRQRTMDFLIGEAEKAIKEKNQLAAEICLEECTRVGIRRSLQTSDHSMLPRGVEVWDFPEVTYNWPEQIVSSRETIHRLIRLWEKVAPSHPKLAERKYSLQLALINKDLKNDPENDTLKKLQDSTYRDMKLLSSLQYVDEIKLAKIIEIGDKLGDQNLGSTLPTKKVRFKTIENIRGDEVGDEFLFDYAIGDIESCNEGMRHPIAQKEDFVPPKIGDLKLVMLFKGGHPRKYVAYQEYNGMLEASPEKIDKVKSIVASQKRYFDGAYKLSAERKEYWERDFKNRKERVLGKSEDGVLINLLEFFNKISPSN